jgi:hypothetical protein
MTLSDPRPLPKRIRYVYENDLIYVYLDERGHGVDVARVPQNGLYQSANAKTNSPGRVTLQLDHFVRAVNKANK